MEGKEFIDRILAYEPSASTGSKMLDSIGRLPFDGHDARGAVSIATEALSQVPASDPFHPTLKAVAEFAREDGRYTGATMRGILFICRDAVGRLLEPVA